MNTISPFLPLFLCVFIPAAGMAQNSAATPPPNAVAVVGGQAISQEELDQTLGSQLLQLRTQEYELKSKALDSLIWQRLVEAEAKKRGISVTQLMEQEVDSKAVPPTDAEVEAFFWGQNKTGVRFESVKDQFRENLRQIKLNKGRQAYAESLKSKIAVAVLLPRPTVAVAYDAARVKGSANAPVTIVEFSDYQCPYCQKTEPVLKNLLQKYDGKVKLAYLDFPLSQIHPQAEIAAEASRCALEQGKFWPFHDVMYSDQSKLNANDLIASAGKLGMDEKAFRGCLGGGKYKPAIEQDVQQGVRAGVAGTPGFFINGVFLNGAQPQAEFEKIIDNELAAKSSQAVSK